MKIQKKESTKVTIVKIRNGQYWVNFNNTLPSKSLIIGRKNIENISPDEASKYRL